MLGLVRKHSLDDACPKINARRAHGAGSYHPLEQKYFAKLVPGQLAENPDNRYKPLGKQGARGALFRLTLQSYEYAFVARGTVTVFKATSNYEGLVYGHLHEVQGELIPVYLRNFSLVCSYFLDVGIQIVHMLLMSWAGEQASKDLVPVMGRDFTTETSCAVTKLLGRGLGRP